jgi:hypothetical protein
VDVDVIYSDSNSDMIYSDSNSDMIVVGIGSDSDSNVDSEYDEDVIEPLSAHDYEILNNFDELPFCVSQKGKRRDMPEKPEKRDVVDDINPEGGYDNEKTADVQEKPEKRDDIDSNIDFDFDAEYDAVNMHAGESLEKDAEWVTGD